MNKNGKYSAKFKSWIRNHSQILMITLITISISVILISLGLWLYASKLDGIGTWSSDSSDWGSFGGFIAGIIGVPATLFSGILIYSTVRMQIKENQKQQNSQTLMTKTEEILLKLSDLQSFTQKLFTTVEIDRENYMIEGMLNTDENDTPQLVTDVDKNINDEDFESFLKEVDQKVQILSEVRILNELYIASSKENSRLIRNYLREVDRFLYRYNNRQYVQLLGDPFKANERKSLYIEIRTKLKRDLGVPLSYMDNYTINKSKK